MKPAQRILVLTYWGYDEALVQAYTMPYVRLMLEAAPAGSTVHLVTLEKGAGVLRPRSTDPSVVHHPFRYARFGVGGALMAARVLLRLLRVIRRERITCLHAWCTPAGALGWVLSVLAGRPLVIDSFEPHAEAMVENGTWPPGGIAHRLLFALERLQSRRASRLIACAEGMKDYAHRKYGVLLGQRMDVKPACVDLDRFDWRSVKRPDLLRQWGLEDKVVAVYAGKFGGIYLEQEVFDLLRAARDHWGGRLRVLLLTPHRREELEPMMRNASLDPGIFIIHAVPHAEVADWMGLADFALTPVKPVPTKALCTPIKDGEYWALGLPVIITPGISDDSAIIERHGIGAVLDGLNAEAYRRAVNRIDALLTSGSRRALYDRIRPVAERYRSFGIARTIYQRIYGG
ncbi:MAG: glycosyltransferase [Flavobacteriales bacterium]|jgi:hypothetical protein|nr:glycosyltransferase [Flavobacteriales bacterium]